MMLRWLMETLPQILIYILIAPWVIGLVEKFKARFQGRQGPSPFQPYWDIWKHFHRRAVIPETTSWIFSAAPFIVFGCYVIIAALVPVIFLSPGSPVDGQGGGPPFTDFLVVVFLIGLAHFSLALAGMDSGSPLGGMGSSRQMFMHMLVEPVLILVAYAMAISSWTTSLSGVMDVALDIQNTNSSLTWGKVLTYFFHSVDYLISPPLILITLALILVILAETGRTPFDNQASHLELTMIGKAIRLEYSGHNLTFLEWAGALRLTFFLTLLVNLLLPRLLIVPGLPFWLILLFFVLYPLKLWTMAIGLAAWESTRARLRLRGMRTPGGLALAFAIFAIILAAINRYFIY
jgi:formate hydrogenlyase subunit 4